MIDDMVGGGMYMWVLLIVVIVGVFYVLTGRPDQKRPSKPGETPLDIVETRYAKGEITKEDYEQMKHDLSS